MTTFILISAFIFGTILGSFFNVVIYRVPRHESIVYGSSHCTHCMTPIQPYDLIPIVSYLFLRGRCRHCHAPISIRYPLIEFLTGSAFALIVNRFGLTYEALIGIILSSILIIISMIDIDTMEIPDRFQIGILVLAFANLFLTPQPLGDHLIGFFIISMPFLLIAWLTQGMGGADIKLIGISGLLLGYKSILVAFFISALTGGIYALFLLILKHQSRKTAVPFGPFLCVGIFIAFLYGLQIFEWYIHLFI